MYRKSFITALCIVELLCSGCSRQPQIDPLTIDSVILAFGDSLTQGSGAEPEESYPAQLEKLTGHRIINAGVAGEISSAGLRRLPDVLKNETPTLVILCHGGNDMLHKSNLNIMEQNLRTMISLTKESGADVILVAVPKPGIILKPAEAYKKLADEFRIPLDEKSLSRILQNPANKADAIHPNAIGYQKLADALADLIEKSQ